MQDGTGERDQCLQEQSHWKHNSSLPMPSPPRLFWLANSKLANSKLANSKLANSKLGPPGPTAAPPSGGCPPHSSLLSDLPGYQSHGPCALVFHTGDIQAASGALVCPVRLSAG